ncbi:Large tegument protein like [Actinidia chinensis var. chinensis]|uniref:Large tegument protein like n=1 Tax=Actinidia chinensis var. chinensis TaxID=1590841 RepID=A0A2R6P500_ACTCC|nr:Large tegument protein like [Actinidia chinensis var. chinensis]
MGSQGIFPENFTWVWTFLLLSLFPNTVKTQIQGCSFLGLDLNQCLDQGKNSISIDSCCSVLNQAVQAGFYCLCSLLASSGPLSSIPLLLPLSNCFISAPPLTQCRALVPIKQPPAIPSLPVLLPPDISEDPPQPSAPNNFSLQPPPQEAQVPLNSTPDTNSTIVAMQPSLGHDAAPNLTVFRSGCLISNGQKTKNSLQSRLSLVVTLLAII